LWPAEAPIRVVRGRTAVPSMVIATAGARCWQARDTINLRDLRLLAATVARVATCCPSASALRTSARFFFVVLGDELLLHMSLISFMNRAGRFERPPWRLRVLACGRSTFVKNRVRRSSVSAGIGNANDGAPAVIVFRNRGPTCESPSVASATMVFSLPRGITTMVRRPPQRLFATWFRGVSLAVVVPP